MLQTSKTVELDIDFDQAYSDQLIIEEISSFLKLSQEKVVSLANNLSKIDCFDFEQTIHDYFSDLKSDTIDYYKDCIVDALSEDELKHQRAERSAYLSKVL